MDCIDHNELFTLWSIVADLNPLNSVIMEQDLMNLSDGTSQD